MVEVIESYLSSINHELAVFVISMLPIVELRGAIPYGVALGVDWLAVYFLSVIGNLIPAPFIVLFFRPIIEYLEKTKLFGKLANKLKTRANSKIKDVTKYKMLGLFIFVAVPLPGTGAWTGALIAALLGIRIKHSLPIITLGVITAGLIMSFVSYVLPVIIALF